MIFQREISAPPLPDSATIGDWALFLDLDGTLIDLAPTPDSVSVPENLVETLAALHARLAGAVAIVSGRTVAMIDHLLQPLRLAAAGEHGAILRLSDGEIVDAGERTKVPVSWRREIYRMAGQWPGSLVEEKSFGIAVHFRADPALGPAVSAALLGVIGADPDFELLPAAMAFEIRHRDSNKGIGLRRLMETAPFSGRRPLFIGDDVTDEDAVYAAQALGGVGLRVPELFAGQPSRVRAWLRELSGRN
jgi:trehalose 6-phosphate phosphatase